MCNPVLFTVGSAFMRGGFMRGGFPFMRGGCMRGGFPGVFGHYRHHGHHRHCGERAFWGGLVGGLAGNFLSRIIPGLGVGRDIANYNIGARDGYQVGASDGYQAGYYDGFSDGQYW